MRLFVVWSTEENRSGLPIRAGDVALCFDPMALDLLRASGVTAVDADSLLSWETRARIDEQATALAARLASDGGLADVRAAGQPLIEFAHHDLLIELSNLLRGFELGDAVAGDHRIDELGAQSNAPSSVRLGVWAGVAARNGAAGAMVSLDPWTPISSSGSHNRAHALVAHGVLAAMGATRRRHRIRVLAVPAAKVAAALERLDRADLLRAGVGIANFPGLSQGSAVRLALTSGLPTAPTAGLPVPHERPARSHEWPIPTLVGSAPLQTALHTLVERVLLQSYEPTVRVSRTLRLWESLPDLRALLLPYTAVGPARLAARWAHARGVTVAVVQHGVYGLRTGLGADMLADQVFGWGPGVAEQVAAWPEGRPRISSVGVPDLLPSTRREPPVSIRRVLVATTNRPLGSAIGAYGLREAFIEDLIPGLRQLSEAGVRVELRLHPAESRFRYRALLAKLGLELPFSGDGPFAELANLADIVVSAVSSVAFEAAVLGRPVLLWGGRMPQEIRERCLLPPFSDALPGQFVDGRQFADLARRGLQDPGALIAEGRALADCLCHYAQPLDTALLAAAILQLGTGATLSD